jgi:hypothetical protein
MSRTKSYVYTCIICGREGQSQFKSACVCEPCARERVAEYRTLPHLQPGWRAA